jgi:hypothetical protein
MTNKSEEILSFEVLSELRKKIILVAILNLKSDPDQSVRGADPDPDPYQHVMDPQHCFEDFSCSFDVF